MKRILFLFVILIVAIGLQAQNFKSALKPDVTYLFNTSKAVVKDTSSYEVQWEIRSHYPFTYSIGFYIDSISGVASKDTLYIDGRIDTEDNWINLGTIIPDENSQAIRLTNDSIAVRYRWLRALYSKKDTSNIRIKYHWLKIWRE